MAGLEFVGGAVSVDEWRTMSERISKNGQLGNLAGTLSAPASATVGSILVSMSVAHLLNDTMQAAIPAIYPLLKSSFALTFAQVGLITLTFQLTASVLQPLVGAFTDRRPLPYALAGGMALSLLGMVGFARADSFVHLLLAAACVGLGSAVFHPEASKVAHMAAGARRGFAQSLFQVGGNAGSALGPLLAAVIVMPYGQGHLAWFALVALLGMGLMMRTGKWYAGNLHRLPGRTRAEEGTARRGISRVRLVAALAVLMALVFSKYFYLASMTSFYTFYLMQRFGVSAQHSQVLLFIFMAAVAAGTIIGGPVGDRIGRKRVIWVSILGAAPFSLLLPHVNLAGTVGLSAVIGVVLASAFSAILVYAQELVPGRVGLISGLFFGLAFGMGGIGSAVLGKLADLTSIGFVFQLCAFLPLLGLLTALLPSTDAKGAAIARRA